MRCFIITLLKREICSKPIRENSYCNCNNYSEKYNDPLKDCDTAENLERDGLTSLS